MAYITLLFYDHLEYRLLYFLVYFCFKPILYFFFFFQAEDGIRDFHVTGVQTCCSSDLLLLQPQGSRAGGRPGAAPAGSRLCPPHRRDRKSTRLNSSHVKISYAVFCL